MKEFSSVAFIAGLLSQSPTLLVAIIAVGAVIVVLATYLLIAKREVAPRIRWGKLRIDFDRLPKRKD